MAATIFVGAPKGRDVYMLVYQGAQVLTRLLLTPPLSPSVPFPSFESLSPFVYHFFLLPCGVFAPFYSKPAKYPKNDREEALGGQQVRKPTMVYCADQCRNLLLGWSTLEESRNATFAPQETILSHLVPDTCRVDVKIHSGSKRRCKEIFT